MNVPNSTPFPVATFDSSAEDGSASQFLEFLRNLIKNNLDSDPPLPIPAANRGTWVPVIVALSDHFLTPLPSHHTVPWNAMHEKVKLVEITLEVVQRLTDRLDALYAGPGDLAKKIVARLLNLCTGLDVWMDVDVPEEKDIPLPSDLRQKACQTTVCVLRCLGSSLTTVGGSEEPIWKILRHIATECVDVCHDVLSVSQSAIFPLTVVLFDKPHFAEAKSNDPFIAAPKISDFSIILENVSQLPLFLSLLLEVICKSLSPNLPSQCFLVDVMRRLTGMASSILDFCLSSSCSSSLVTRTRSVVRVVVSTTHLISMSTGWESAVENLLCCLMRHRMQEGPSVDWEGVDSALRKAFERPLTCSPSKEVVTLALDVLRIDAKGDNGNEHSRLVAIYLHACLSHLNVAFLQEAKNVLPQRAEMQDIIDAIIRQLGTMDPVQVVDPNPSAGSGWRAHAKGLLGDILLPDNIRWMDDDGTMSDRDYKHRVLVGLRHRYNRPMVDTPASQRMRIAAGLTKLSCCLVHPNRPDCVFIPDELISAFAASHLACISRLLEGNNEEVTPQVRKSVYDALTCTVKHIPSKSTINALKPSCEIVIGGLADDDRNIRLKAGRALVELTRVFGNHDFKQNELLFTSLHRLLDNSKSSVKETVLITVGKVGRSADTDTLGLVVCLLIAQLGSKNLVIKGTAYMQLLSLSKLHDRSTYALVSPYLHMIAPFLVSQICLQPSLLTETCRFLCISPTDFLSVNLSRTLPYLFGQCDRKVLETIAKDLSKKLSSLFLNFSHEILAYVFQLSAPGQTNKALAFILQVLRDAADGVTIDVQSVVKSCVVPLLAELVIVMGDENAERAEMAVNALKKVERSLSLPGRNQRPPPPESLGSFLKKYMLGVISNINEMLQDVQGKKSMSIKRQILRSFGALVIHIGPAINNVAPQIMATFQTMLGIPELAEVTLESWHTFLTALAPSDIGPHVGPTSASFVSTWPKLSSRGRGIAKRSLEYIVLDVGNQIGHFLDDIVDLSAIPELFSSHERLKVLRDGSSMKERLQRLLERSSSDNLTVAVQSLRELKSFMSTEHKDLISNLASGDIFDPLVAQILDALFAAACRDGDTMETVRSLAFECIGVLGAVDPDRCEVGSSDNKMVMLNNFTDEGESVLFALHLIRDLLVGAFRSTSDIKHQSHLAYSIQELLRFCKFTPALVTAEANSSSVPIKVRNRWKSLPKHVLETVTPLLEARFTLDVRPMPELEYPIYSKQSTYREWIQLWTSSLITRASGEVARSIFGVFRSAVRNKDVGVAHHLLPHLVLNILISGAEEDSNNIRSEILAVLDDQVNSNSTSTADKKLLSAQAVFMLLDHLNTWVRQARQEIRRRLPENKRARVNHVNSSLEEQLLRIDSILSSIDQHLMAKAALQCKSYARALMNFERQIVVLKENSPTSEELPLYYERLHEIYAHLDEPDGMEGVSTLILSPSLEHQIRQHESTGRWTSAQSCWEVRLQQCPDNLDFHLGLLRCLRNLGHYDTLRTHVKGVLTRNPDWGQFLMGFQVECAWMVGAWNDVQNLVERTNNQTGPIVMARLLLAMRTDDSSAIANASCIARSVLGAPITASGTNGYRRSYDAVLNLHLVHELELIHRTTTLSKGSQASMRRALLTDLSKTLSSRLDITLPTFRVREPVLSMRRTAFALASTSRKTLDKEIGRSWIASAKIARKAKQWQTAYCSMLQAQQIDRRFSFMESAKLVKVTGEPLRALQELENSMRLLGLIEEKSDIIDLTDDEESKTMKAKAHVLRARWMNESDRYETSQILKAFQTANDLCPKWESGHYHLGQYHDECFKNLSASDQQSRGLKMNLYTVRFFAKAIKFGSKYVYQTVPRLLTIWLDLGENENLSNTDPFKKLNEAVARAIKETPVYKWFTAFPQIVSRVGHTNEDVYSHLSNLIAMVLQEYPKQALWLFTSVVKSTKSTREQRGKAILDQLQNNPSNARTAFPTLIQQSLAMTNELLALCDYHIGDDPKKTLTMSRDFPRLSALGQSRLLIPLQESLNASLPPNSSSGSDHQPFPPNAPLFEKFFDEIEIMRSLAKPRKITILGSDGQVYMFLGKPKDDLRKDARLMDFNAIINKLLKANSESRRRQLRIRTYGVITLNEECGFIQWVPNTIPIRPVLVAAYDARRIRSNPPELNDVFRRMKEMTDKDAAQMFVDKVLPKHPPVFHEWFVETFPEPSAWLASRLAYGRTAAVMSMVGFILGLGDRHCENILLDTNTGDVVHVDFNCLFEKGKTLETPERVPFRLTHNIIDGLGVTGVEGVFRIACEVTMQLLHDNKDSLMSMLDAFIHDPLVEWEDEKRKLEREPQRRNNVKASVDLRMLAKNALSPIEKKLKGIYSTSKERQEREISMNNLVQALIQEAASAANLSKMYPGWASWH